MVNPITGELINGENKKGKIFYFLKGTEPYADYSYDLDSVFKQDEEENLDNDNSNNNNESNLTNDDGNRSNGDTNNFNENNENSGNNIRDGD